MCIVRKSAVIKMLALGVVFACLSWSVAFAQQAEPKPTTIPVLLQGKEIKLPEDFVARLDGNRLKVALKSFGLAERHPDRDLLVSLIQDDGVTTEARVNANGEATFENVKEGLASIVGASGQSAYFAIPFYAAAAVENNPAKAFEVPVASVDERDVRTGVQAAGTAPQGNAATSLADYTPGVANRFQVYLQADGVLLGRVIVPEVGFESAPGAVNLSFYRNGLIVGKTVSSVDGKFAVAGLQPGLHSVFANGPPGHAAFAFEILPPKTNEIPFSNTAVDNPTHFVASRLVVAEPANELIVLIIPPRLMPFVRGIVNSKYPIPSVESLAGPGVPVGAGAPMGGFPGVGGLPGGGFGGGGFGGGGSGGGGFGGGLGGIGGLLGVAGLATGVAAIANDDDGFNVNLATPIAQP